MKHFDTSQIGLENTCKGPSLCWRILPASQQNHFNFSHSSLDHSAYQFLLEEPCLLSVVVIFICSKKQSFKKRYMYFKQG